MKLWRSGIIFSMVGLITGLGNFYFAGLMARLVEKTEWGYIATTAALIGFLTLPLQIVSMSLVHYIAHFRGANDEARLQGLLLGSRQFLLKITVVGSLLATLLLHPLSHFFNFPRASLMLVALICVILSLWATFATTLCQGMAWFKRLALINLSGVFLQIFFGWVMASKYSSAESAVSAQGFMLLANLALLYWWKDLFKKGGEQVSPWNKEFLAYLLMATAGVSGSYFFNSGDLLVAQRYFTGTDVSDFSAAGKLARGLPMVVQPLLFVLFTSRSGRKDANAAQDQRILLGLYTFGLIVGALALFLLKDFLVTLLLGHHTPTASAMISPFAITMIFIGLSQVIGTWSLASRWSKMSILYGALGLIYWLALLTFGRTPDTLLMVMPIGALTAFLVLCTAWLLMLRQKNYGQKLEQPTEK